MKSIHHPGRPALVGLAVCCALATISLTACGGSSSSHQVSEPSTPTDLIITANNAPAVAAQVLVSPQALQQPARMVENIPPNATCSGSGSVTITREDATPNRLLSVVFDKCAPSSGPGGPLYDGSLTFTYLNTNTDSPYTLVVDHYQYQWDDQSGSVERIEKTAANGTFEFTNGSQKAGGFSPSVTANGTFSYYYYDGGHPNQVQDMAWTLNHFAAEDTDTATGHNQTFSGQMTLGSPAGKITIVTGSPLIYDTANCPSSGDITVNGGNGTYMKATFNNSNEVVVTINGNANTYTCTGFGDWWSGNASPTSLTSPRTSRF